MLFLIVRIFAILMVGFALEDKVRYDKYKVLEIFSKEKFPPEVRQEILKHQVLKNYSYKENNVTVLVEPNEARFLNLLLTKNNISHSFLETNIDILIDNLFKRQFFASAKGRDLDWDLFYPLETIYAWLDCLEKDHPDIVELIHIGKSYEGRPIIGVKISRAKGNPTIFVEAGIHGMEWIGASAATYVIKHLVDPENADYRDRIEKLIPNFNFIVVPICNPDGYKYSFDVDRMWRKNRQPTVNGCIGIDLNRNWNVSETDKDTDACSNTYPGQTFSAPETKSISTFLRNHVELDRIRFYFSIHDAAQSFLYPYAQDDSKPHNAEDLKRVGRGGAYGMFDNGMLYNIGTFYEHLGEVKGTSIDWVYNKLEIPLVFFYGLRRVISDPKFTLPSHYIRYESEDTLNGLVHVIEAADSFRYFNMATKRDITKENLEEPRSLLRQTEKIVDIVGSTLKKLVRISLILLILSMLSMMCFYAQRYSMCCGRSLTGQTVHIWEAMKSMKCTR